MANVSGIKVLRERGRVVGRVYVGVGNGSERISMDVELNLNEEGTAAAVQALETIFEVTAHRLVEEALSNRAKALAAAAEAAVPTTRRRGGSRTKAS